MRTFIFIILLAVAVTAALLWNRRFTTRQVGTQPREQLQEEELDRVTVMIGTPPGKQIPRRKPSRPPVKRPRPAPVVKPKPAPEPAPPPPPVPVQRKAVLRKGETVYRMALRLLGKGSRYKEILRLNGLTERDATTLPTGTELLIPER